MPVSLFIAVGALFLAVLLLLLGLRGRRVNDHPVCRRCRFDLAGVYPGGAKCPECGAGLEEARATRVGVRRRRRGALVLAGLCGVVMIGAGVLAGSQLAGAFNANQYKPMWMLLWEAEGSGDSVANAALDELVDRQANGRLGSGEEPRLIERALAYQGDVSKPWRTGWGMLVESAWRSGVLRESERARYVSQGLILAFEARPMVRAMDPLPIELVLEHRFDDAGFLEIYLRHCGTMAAGSLVSGLDNHVIVGSRDFTPPSPAGRSVNLRGVHRLCLVGRPDWPDEIAEALGEIPVVSRWVLEVVDCSANTRRPRPYPHRYSTDPLNDPAPYHWVDDPNWAMRDVDGTEFNTKQALAHRMRLLGAVPVAARRVEFARKVEVVDPSVPGVSLSNDAAEVAAAISALANGAHIFASAGETRFVPPSLHSLRAPMAFDVFARRDGVDYHFETLIYEPPGRHGVGWSSYRREGIYGVQNGYIHPMAGLDRWEIVLRPSLELARETVWIDRIIDHEIVLPSVQYRSAPGRRPSRPR